MRFETSITVMLDCDNEKTADIRLAQILDAVSGVDGVFYAEGGTPRLCIDRLLVKPRVPS